MTTVTGAIRTLISTALPGSQLRWKYQSFPAHVGGALVSSVDDVVTVASPTGIFSQTLTAGIYLLTIDGNNNDRWTVAVPDDNLTYDVLALITSPITILPAIPTPAVSVLQWAVCEGYEYTSSNYDADGVVTTATVKWADGSVGLFTTTQKNPTFLTTDAYTITHLNSGRTVTQAAVTRDASGRVTVKPALTIS